MHPYIVRHECGSHGEQGQTGRESISRPVFIIVPNTEEYGSVCDIRARLWRLDTTQDVQNHHPTIKKKVYRKTGGSSALARGLLM